jgi:hypothetical protein
MRNLFALIVFVLLVSGSADAQSSVTLRGTVSETVALSVSPSFTFGNANVVTSGNTVQLTLSSTDAGSEVIRVPLLVRSNTAFKISAVFDSKTAELAQLLVTDVRATGNLVSPHIVNAVEKSPKVNPDSSQPVLVLTGPRVSLGGTLTSPNNALQVTLLIRLKPQRPPGAVVHLTLIGQPVSRAP